MNLYECRYDNDWICYVFAETRGKAKCLFNKLFVTFTITTTFGAASPTDVRVKLVSNGGAWFDCTAGQNYSWSCQINGQVTVLEADELRVIAVQ